MGSTVNVVSANMQIEYWDGSEWKETVEIRDRTNGFQQSGFVTFVPNERDSWAADDTAEKLADTTLRPEIPDLGTVVIYGRYWIRISMSAGLTANTAIKWIGNKFSDDNDLGAQKPGLDRQVFRDLFTETPGSKADYEEQHVLAGELILEDLVDQGVIWHKGQVLSRDKFKNASVSKVAELIYDQAGPNFVERRDDARRDYNERIQKMRPEVDKNKDGILHGHEVKDSQEFMSR
jgi:hypothetical protein